MKGYAYNNDGVCESCANIVCSLGEDVSSTCQTPAERLQLPFCFVCPNISEPLNLPSQGRIPLAGPGCKTTCAAGV